MTTYNGTNMGLEQNADGTWVFTNPAQTFIDPATFSTADPPFPTADTTTDDTTTEEDTTCEEGYIYDNTLKKCVPEVTEYERQVAAYTGGQDGDRDDQQNYVDFREMSYDEMVDFGKKEGYFNEAGTFIGASETTVPFPFMKGIAQFGEDSQANRFAINFAKKGGKIWNPMESSFIGNLYIPERDDLARLIAGTETFDIASDYNKKVHDFGVTAMNTVTQAAQFDLAKTEREDYFREKQKQKLHDIFNIIKLNLQKLEQERLRKEKLATADVQDVITKVTDIGTQPRIPFVERDTLYEQAQEEARVLAASKKSTAPVLTKTERAEMRKESAQRREESERQMRGAAQRESQAVSRGDKQQARQAREEYKTAVERSGYSRA